MIVLRIFGILLLVLLAFGVLMTLLTLCLPVRIEVKRTMPDGPLRMRMGFGPLKRVITFGKKKPKKQTAKKTPQKAPKKAKRPKTPSAPRVDIKRLDLYQIWDLALDLIDDMAGAMTWERLHVTLLLHTKDAARTGILLGKLCAAVGNLYPYMERAFVLKDTKIVLDADFEAEQTVWGVDLSVMTRAGRFPCVLWRRKKQLWNLWKSIRLTKQERRQWMKEHPQMTAEQKT